MIEDTYPLIPLQQGFLLNELVAPGSGVDVLQIVISLPERVDPAALEAAWQRAIGRHPVLRTGFVMEHPSGPHQRVHREARVDLEFRDWRRHGVLERAERMRELLLSDRLRPFDLTQPPLMRLSLLQWGREDGGADQEAVESRLIWTFPHAILDGRSFGRVIEEVFAEYDAATEDASAPRATGGAPGAEADGSSATFGDYARWLAARDGSTSDAYWRDYLDGVTTPTPFDAFEGEDAGNPRGAWIGGYGRCQRRLTPHLTRRIEAFVARHDLTLGTVVLGVWALVLSRWSGEEDVVFGTTRACRHGSIAGTDALVGMLINTVATRVRVPADAHLVPWLEGLRAQLLAVRPHERTPLSTIQRASSVPGDRPLFDSLVVFEKDLLARRLRALGGRWATRKLRILRRPNVPLSVAAFGGETLALELSYDQSRLSRGTARQVLGHFATLLAAIGTAETADGAGPRRGPRLRSLSMLSAGERRQVLESWNETPKPRLDSPFVHELVAARAASTPDALALECRDHRISYRELVSRARSMAAVLRKRGVGVEDRVAVALEPSSPAVVAMLAILEAGAAYVPLDAGQPAERRRRLVATVNAALVVVDGVNRDDHARAEAPILEIEAWLRAEEEPVELPPAPLDPQNLAYVIFTSGSTGQPKGSMVSHRAIVNRILWQVESYGADREERVLQKTPFSFDVSVWEIFWPLAIGARLVLAEPGGHRDPAYLAELIEDTGVTTVHFVPAMLDAFLQLPDLSSFTSVRRLIASGEAISLDLERRALERLQTPLFNHYGPTEAAVEVSSHACRGEVESEVPIGRPIRACRLSVLAKGGDPAPLGSPGELAIGGVCLARGYVAQPALTAECFVPDPWSGVPGGRLYLSGDLARCRADGEIAFLGRLDDQIKIRGFRIELGEIESALRASPGVRAAVVLAPAGEDGQRRLAAYVEPEESGLELAPLKEHLLRRLPAFMVPEHYAEVDRMPTLASGKVNRKALAGLALEDLVREAYVAPRTPLEQELVSLCEELLGVETLGIHDHFFRLGGHSLLATQLLTRLGARHGIELSLTEFFETPTVAELAQAIEVARWVSQPEAGEGAEEEWEEVEI